MKSNLRILSVFVPLAVAASVASAAEVHGKVKFSGTPAPEVTIRMDAICGKLAGAAPVTTRHFVVGEGNGLGDVFVYISKGANPTPATGPGPLLDQKGCMYEPYIWGVVTGQEFTVQNSDAVLHNVHATPKVNKEFNFGQPLKGQKTTKSFDKPEVLVRVKCDVHPWMFTYVGVCDHPYFAVTDKDGNFKIPNLPAGTYTLEAHHRKAQGGTTTQEFTVGASDSKEINFTLSVP